MSNSSGAPPYPQHFDGKRFFNPGATRARGFLDVLRWQLTSSPEPSPRKLVDDVAPTRPPPAVAANELRVTMVNHSTVLLQIGTVHILTDPIWSERASPLTSIGPRRYRVPGVRMEDLPRIDIILLSHNHYDHLDLSALHRLSKQFAPQFIVPLGVADLARSQNIGNPHELDWGDSVSVLGTTIHAVPAAHFSARGLFDRNRTLWCGYVIEMAGTIIYFAADTGFGDHFAQIYDRHGPPHVAFLPIGAYEPRWFMGPIHMGPDEAVRAHQILGAKKSIAIHHGTFKLADEGIDTPKRALRACAPSDDSFLVLDNGQFLTIPL